MQTVGFKLIDDKTGEAIKEFGGEYNFCPGFPNPLILPNGDHVCAGKVNESYGGYTVVPWEMEQPSRTTIEGAEFLTRVTDEEYEAITSSPIVQVRRWLDIFRLRGEIDVSGTTAKAAKAGLVAAKLLTSERAEEIFAAG